MARAPFAVLTPRDVELLEVLTRRLKALSLAQIARTWWRQAVHPEESARTRLRVLEHAGFIRSVSLTAHTEVPLEAPLAVWHPGALAPDLAHVAYRLQTRWASAPVRTPGVIATASAGRRFGGRGGETPRRADATHDLHLAALYLKFRDESPERATSWTLDRFIAAARANKALPLPDALVMEGGALIAVEMGGSSYQRAKLEALHTYCEAEGCAYEIW